MESPTPQSTPNTIETRAKILCIKCGSDKLQVISEVEGKGVSGTKVCLFGICGLCGAGKTKTTNYWICQNCGTKFKA